MAERNNLVLSQTVDMKDSAVLRSRTKSWSHLVEEKAARVMLRGQVNIQESRYPLRSRVKVSKSMSDLVGV